MTLTNLAHIAAPISTENIAVIAIVEVSMVIAISTSLSANCTYACKTVFIVAPWITSVKRIIVAIFAPQSSCVNSISAFLLTDIDETNGSYFTIKVSVDNSQI